MTTIVLADSIATNAINSTLSYKQVEAGTYLVVASLEGADSNVVSINLFVNIGPVENYAIKRNLDVSEPTYVTLPRCTIAVSYVGLGNSGEFLNVAIARVGSSYNTAVSQAVSSEAVDSEEDFPIEES